MKKQQIKAFKSVQDSPKPEISPIIGNVPDWVTGRLFRNCPGKWDYPKFKLNHVFDGYAIICKFEVRGGKDGKVAFSSKFLQSEAFKKAEIEQKPVIAEYSTRSGGADSSKSFLAKALTSVFPDITDNVNFIMSSVICRNPIVAGHHGYIFELDMKTLNIISRHTPLPTFGVISLTPYPMTDSETGETYIIGIDPLPTPKWKILKFPRGCASGPLRDTVKKAKVVCTYPARTKISIPWLHSFGLTRNYIIWIDQPYYGNLGKCLGALLKPICPKEMMEWAPQMKCQFCLYNKHTGQFMSTEILSSEGFYFQNVINSYEDQDHIVIEVFTRPNMNIVDSLIVANLREGRLIKDQDCPRLFRYVIPLCVDDIKNIPENRNLVRIQTEATAVRSGDKIILEPEIMSEIKMDSATYNKKFYGQSLRFIWATGAFAPSKHHNRIVKFDLKTKKALMWEAAGHQYVGEPQFVRRPHSTVEDDGVIVLVVVNYLEKTGDKDCMVFLDAKDLKELGRASFEAEIPIALATVWHNNVRSK